MTAPSYVHRQPAWTLTVDGQEISPTVRPRLQSISLTEKRGADADELEIRLLDHDGQLAIPPKGASITLSLGWKDLGVTASPFLVDKGTFRVDEVGHDGAPDILTIRARSADLTRDFRRKRAQSWSNITLGDVLGQIAGRNGLQLRCSADKAAVALSHLAQSGESDAALLARLGRLHDAAATVKAGSLIFMARGAGQTPGGQDLAIATITRADGDRHSWKASDRGVYSGVIAEWHDRASAVRRKVVAGSDANPLRLSRTYSSEATARRAAETRWSAVQRGSASFSLQLARGRPDLFPEKTVTVQGFKPQIDAPDWLITEASHTLNASGLMTSLQMELGGSSRRDGT